MLRSYVGNGMRSVRRLLAFAAVAVSLLAFWSTAAEATIRCTSKPAIVCDRYQCCFFTCVICVDTRTGEVVGSDCQATVCYSKQV